MITTAQVLMIISSVVWFGVSVTVLCVSMNNSHKIETLPHALTLTILWPLIGLVQGVTHVLPCVRAVVAFVPRCFRALRTFAGILGQGTQVTLRGGIPELPGKITTYY